MPCAMRNALNGEMAEPRSRRSWTRALSTYARLAPRMPPTPRSRA
ncbi:Uncharacterised protein [Mycobacteroides abscessus]|nr:Uncharacterised protein [Mycobacteroides abscessus]